MTDTHTNVLVRMTNEMKALLQRESKLHGRSLTAEITDRLGASLAAAKAPAITPGGTYPISTATAHLINNAEAAQEKSPAQALTDLDRAMLAVFHSLPVEKQLALLSLFRP